MNAFLHLHRDLVDLDRDAPRFAERGNQLVVRGVDAQGHLQAHVAQRFDRGQARRDQPIGNADRDAAEHEPEHDQNQADNEETQKQMHETVGEVTAIKLSVGSP